MGTCAGCILLAKKLDGNEINTLGLMDIEVKRNAFGRQRESFQCLLDIEGFREPFPAVFIRAPLIKKVWEDCTIMAREKNKLALAFHPELTDDLRIHQYFLEML